jgi:hypothetical protein
MHLNHALGQVDTYPNRAFSDNLLHGLPLSVQIEPPQSQSWYIDTVMDWGSLFVFGQAEA